MNLYKWNYNDIHLQFDRLLSIFVQRGCSNRYSLRQFGFAHPCQHSVLSNSLIFANGTGENELISLVFILISLITSEI